MTLSRPSYSRKNHLLKFHSLLFPENIFQYWVFNFVNGCSIRERSFPAHSMKLLIDVGLFRPPLATGTAHAKKNSSLLIWSRLSESRLTKI